MYVWSWYPAPPEAHVLRYDVEALSGGNWYVLAQVPNRADVEVYDPQTGMFTLRSDVEAVRISSVSDEGRGPWAYIYPQAPPPAPPIPAVEVRRSDPSEQKLMLYPQKNPATTETAKSRFDWPTLALGAAIGVGVLWVGYIVWKKV
jgi:hypothetical protein